MKNILNKTIITYIIFTSLLAVMSCSDDPDNPVIENEQEVMTTFTYTLTPAEGGAQLY